MKIENVILLSACALFILSVFIFNNVFADTTPQKFGLIGIQLSKTCETELRYHINTTCFSYKDLLKFDNTDPSWAGQWVDDPFYHRINPKLGTYRLNGTVYPWIVMVDPNSNFQRLAHLIVVNPGNFTWINPDDNSTSGLSYKIHNNRMNDNCQTLIVAPNMWLINDTINYIKSGCTQTAYNDTKTFVRTPIPFIMDNPYASWHYKDMLSNIKKENKTYTQDCIHHHCAQVDPYKKAGW